MICTHPPCEFYLTKNQQIKINRRTNEVKERILNHINAKKIVIDEKEKKTNFEIINSKI